MVSTRRSKKPRQATEEGAPSGDSGKDSDPDERLGPVSPHRPESKVLMKARQKGKRPEKRRNAHSNSPDVPLDVMYEVIYGLIRIGGGIHTDALIDIPSGPSGGSTADIMDQ